MFTDVPEGSRRAPDIVIQVNRWGGVPEIIIVHFEVQAERRGDTPFRMWEYYCLLRLRKKLPVIPIVMYLVPGAGGLVSETYSEGFSGIRFLYFYYLVVGPPDLSAEAYAEKDDPLAVSLSVLMLSTEGNRVKRKFRALERIFGSNLDDARASMLAYVVDKYLNLTESEEEEMSQLTTDPATAERYKKWMTSWEEKAWDRGVKHGIEQGIDRGIVQGKHDLILHLIRSKFGQPSDALLAQILEIVYPNRLDDIADKLFIADMVDQLGLS